MHFAGWSIFYQTSSKINTLQSKFTKHLCHFLLGENPDHTCLTRSINKTTFFPNCICLLSNASFVRILYQGLQTLLSEGHINCYTTVREPDILHHVIVSRYVTFCQTKKCFVKKHYFLITDQMSSRAG